MDGINVNIDADQINQYVAEAVLDSSIGDHVRQSIKDRMSDFNLRQSIDKAVGATISKIIYDILNSEHGDTLRSAVHEKISAEVVQDIAGKAFDHWLENR